MKLSGNKYNLKDLFLGEDNEKIVIPDLQRDYCWGTTGTLVEDFMASLIDHFTHLPKENLLMGLIYGYYEQERPYLQLCDGQQRLTTLYLLIGLICRLTGEDKFQDLLISKFELNEDDKEPRLLYAIRDSSLYFMSDLVCNYFISQEKCDGLPSDFIKKQAWWFSEYNSDPTICSILASLDKMKSVLSSVFMTDENFFDKNSLVDFGSYVISMLDFIYHDMVTRTEGEETFVIINTTGEPLSATENLKPIVVTHQSTADAWKKNSEIWEHIDNYFWLHRDSSQDTSDSSMKEFLRLVAGVKDTSAKDYYKFLTEEDFKFPIDDVSIFDIEKVFVAFENLNSGVHVDLLQMCPLLSCTHGEKPFYKKKDLNEYFVILPVLRYCLRYPNVASTCIKRVYSFLLNLTRYTPISQDNNNIRLAIEAIDKLPSPDICSLLDVREQVNRTYILTHEEELRLKILSNLSAEDMRREVEFVFDKISQHPVLQGRIECLIAWSGSVDGFNIDHFKTNAQLFEWVFNMEHNQVMSDLSSISLACMEDIPTYPVEDGHKCDFLAGKENWNFYLYGNKEQSGNWKLLGTYWGLLQGIELAEKNQKKIINDWLSKNNINRYRYYNFVKYFAGNDFIPITFANENDYWQNKRLSILDKNFIRIVYRLNYNWRDKYLFEALPIWCARDDWYPLLCYVGDGGSCLYTDHVKYDIAIDLLLIDSSHGQLRIFQRYNEKKDATRVLKKVIDMYSMSIPKGKERYRTPLMSLSEMIKLFEVIVKYINSEIKNSFS